MSLPDGSNPAEKLLWDFSFLSFLRPTWVALDDSLGSGLPQGVADGKETQWQRCGGSRRHRKLPALGRWMATTGRLVAWRKIPEGDRHSFAPYERPLVGQTWTPRLTRELPQTALRGTIARRRPATAFFGETGVRPGPERQHVAFCAEAVKQSFRVLAFWNPDVPRCPEGSIRP